MLLVKSQYTSTFSFLLYTSIPSGLVSLLALLLLAPACTSSLSRLRTLFTLTTIVFLSNVVLHVPISSLLHPLLPTNEVFGWRRRLLRYGTAVTLLYFYTGFLGLLGIILLLKGAEEGSSMGVSEVGTIVLFVALTIAGIFLALRTESANTKEEVVTERGRTGWRQSEEEPLTPISRKKEERKREMKDVTKLHVGVWILLLVVMVVCLLVIVGNCITKFVKEDTAGADICGGTGADGGDIIVPLDGGDGITTVLRTVMVTITDFESGSSGIESSGLGGETVTETQLTQTTTIVVVGATS